MLKLMLWNICDIIFVAFLYYLQYILLKKVKDHYPGDLTGFHYRDEINEAFVILKLVLWTRTLCLWTETPFRAGLVLSMSTLRAKKWMYGLVWPSPHVNLTRACMVQTPKTYLYARPAQPQMRDDFANALI